MAPETKNIKREASASAPAGEATAKKAKKAAPVDGGKKRKAPSDVDAKPVKKSKPSQAAEVKPKPAADKKKSAAKKTASEKPVAKKIKPEVSDEVGDEEMADAAAESSEDEVFWAENDQTVELLAGFDPQEEDPEPEKGQEYKEGEDVGKISKKAQKQALAAQKKASESDEPGTIYLGRLPHGFYEHEIKSYFSQFGEITKYRVSRNPKTGKSKHYAFVEFKSREVADIVAKTMDNYLLFGHILKCKMLVPEQIHENLWKGANKRFKNVPWNKIEGRRLNEGLDEAGWEKRNEKEEKRRIEAAEKTKPLGYGFESPKLKSAKDVPKTKRVDPLTITAEAEAEAESEPKAIEAAPVEPAVAEPSKGKKAKKDKSTAVKEEVVVKETVVVDEAPAVESSKGKKKDRKAKSAATKEVVDVKAEIVEEAPKVKASKDEKKDRQAKPTETKEVVIEVTEKEVVKEAPKAESSEGKKKAKKQK